MGRDGDVLQYAITLAERDVEYDVAITSSTHTPLPDILDSARELAGLGDARSRPIIERTGLPLEGETLGDSPLRCGDCIRLDDQLPPARWLLWATGPAEDIRLPIPVDEPLLFGRDMLIDGHRLSDEWVSRRQAELRFDGRDVVVSDLDSTNGTFVDGREVTTERVLSPGAVLEMGDQRFVFIERDSVPGTGISKVGPFLHATREAHFPTQAPVRQIALKAPPQKPPEQRVKPAMFLLPLLPAVVMFALFQDPRSFAFLGVMPLIGVYKVIEDRRTGRAGFAERVDEYAQHLAAKRAEAEEADRRGVAWRADRWPDVFTLVGSTVALDSAIWRREPNHPEFLDVRLGRSTQDSLVEIRLPESRDREEPQRTQAEELVESLRLNENAPLALSLSNHRVVGIHGRPESVRGLVRAMLLQLAVLHSRTDVAIGVIATDVRERWHWVRWLPHAGVVDASNADYHQICGDDASVSFQRLLNLVRRRAESPSFSLEPHVIVALEVASIPSAADLQKLKDEAPEFDVSLILMALSAGELGPKLGAVVEVLGDGGGTLSREDTSDTKSEIFQVEALPFAVANLAARRLAPLVDPTQRSDSASLPHRVDLRDIAEAEVNVDAVRRAWTRPPRGLVATVGVQSGGPTRLDLVNDGPHGLVVGATRAGKSEFLQTLVASLTLSYPPSKLNIYLIDYKGGATIEPLRKLPHVTGMLTDRSDPELTERAIVTLRAELGRRSDHITKLHGAKDIDSLARLSPENALPRLLIVVDELAHVKETYPAFPEAFKDITRRGASLGVHLLVATQLPKSIDNDVRGNTALKVVFRLEQTQDSVDILGRPGAEQIPIVSKGRGFYQIGGGGRLTEFQAAYVGGVAGQKSPPPLLDLWRFGDPPPQNDDYEMRTADGQTSADGRTTDLEEIIDVAERARDPGESRWEPTPPPLATCIRLDDVLNRVDLVVARLAAPVGLVDLPLHQDQVPFVLDFGKDPNVLVLGTTQQGKTSLLLTAAAALASQMPPEQLTVYGIDLDRGNLRSLKRMAHCGGVVDGRDEDQLRGMLSFLIELGQERAALLADTGAHDIDEYHRRSGSVLPDCLLLVDNLPELRRGFESPQISGLFDRWMELVPRGSGVGIHTIMTADRLPSIPPKIAAASPRRVVLRLAQDADYRALEIAPPSSAPKWPPGRGVDESGKSIQVALAWTKGEDPSEALHRHSLRAGGARSKNIVAYRPLPRRVASESVLPAAPGDRRLMFGVDERGRAVHWDTQQHPGLLVVGPAGSGRSTALFSFARQFRSAFPSSPRYLIAPRAGWAADPKHWDAVRVDTSDIGDLVSNLAQQREAGFSQGALLMIDDADGLVFPPGAIHHRQIESLLRQGPAAGLVIGGAIRSAYLRLLTPSAWLNALYEHGAAILLRPDRNVLQQLDLPRWLEVKSEDPGRGLVDWYKPPRRIQLIDLASHSAEPPGDIDQRD